MGNQVNLYTGYMMNKFHKISLTIVSILIFPVVVVVFFSYQIEKVQTEVNMFCTSVPIGGDISELKNSLQHTDFRTFETKVKETNKIKMTVWDGFAYFRVFCDIEHDNKNIIAKDIFELD